MTDDTTLGKERLRQYIYINTVGLMIEASLGAKFLRHFSCFKTESTLRCFVFYMTRIWISSSVRNVHSLFCLSSGHDTITSLSNSISSLSLSSNSFLRHHLHADQPLFTLNPCSSVILPFRISFVRPASSWSLREPLQLLHRHPHQHLHCRRSCSTSCHHCTLITS